MADEWPFHVEERVNVRTNAPTSSCIEINWQKICSVFGWQV